MSSSSWASTLPLASSSWGGSELPRARLCLLSPDTLDLLTPRWPLRSLVNKLDWLDLDFWHRVLWLWWWRIWDTWSELQGRIETGVGEENIKNYLRDFSTIKFLSAWPSPAWIFGFEFSDSSDSSLLLSNDRPPGPENRNCCLAWLVWKYYDFKNQGLLQ